jgi:hypothetical protein
VLHRLSEVKDLNVRAKYQRTIGYINGKTRLCKRDEYVQMYKNILVDLACDADHNYVLDGFLLFMQANFNHVHVPDVVMYDSMCPICREDTTDENQFKLPCGHCMCEQDAYSHFRLRMIRDGPTDCPLCKRVYDVREDTFQDLELEIPANYIPQGNYNRWLAFTQGWI